MSAILWILNVSALEIYDFFRLKPLSSIEMCVSFHANPSECVTKKMKKLKHLDKVLCKQHDSKMKNKSLVRLEHLLFRYSHTSILFLVQFYCNDVC